MPGYQAVFPQIKLLVRVSLYKSSFSHLKTLITVIMMLLLKQSLMMPKNCVLAWRNSTLFGLHYCFYGHLVCIFWIWIMALMALQFWIFPRVFSCVYCHRLGKKNMSCAVCSHAAFIYDIGILILHLYSFMIKINFSTSWIFHFQWKKESFSCIEILRRRMKRQEIPWQLVLKH